MGVGARAGASVLILVTLAVLAVMAVFAVRLWRAEARDGQTAAPAEGPPRAPVPLPASRSASGAAHGFEARAAEQ